MDGSPSTRASLLIRLSDPRDDLAWSDFTEIYRPLARECRGPAGQGSGGFTGDVDRNGLSIQESGRRHDQARNRACRRRIRGKHLRKRSIHGRARSRL